MTRVRWFWAIVILLAIAGVIWYVMRARAQAVAITSAGGNTPLAREPTPEGHTFTASEIEALGG